MRLFKSPAPEAPKPPEGPIPIAPIDVSKRYDLYCSFAGEDRLYRGRQDRIRRTLEPERKFSSGLIGGYIEIEARDGTRIMIPHFRIHVVCEHGAHPAFKVLRWRSKEGGDLAG